MPGLYSQAGPNRRMIRNPLSLDTEQVTTGIDRRDRLVSVEGERALWVKMRDEKYAGSSEQCATGVRNVRDRWKIPRSYALVYHFVELYDEATAREVLGKNHGDKAEVRGVAYRYLPVFTIKEMRKRWKAITAIRSEVIYIGEVMQELDSRKLEKTSPLTDLEWVIENLKSPVVRWGDAPSKRAVSMLAWGQESPENESQLMSHYMKNFMQPPEPPKEAAPVGASIDPDAELMKHLKDAAR